MISVKKKFRYDLIKSAPSPSCLPMNENLLNINFMYYIITKIIENSRKEYYNYEKLEQ